MKRGIAPLPAAALLLWLVACSEPVGPEVEGTPQFASASSRLVECPVSTTRSTSKWIGLFGGSVELDGHRVTIPGGALLSPTLITLTVPASNYVEVDLKANNLLNFDFLKPVTVTVSYARCTRSDILSAELSAWYIDSATKELLEDMGGVDDKSSRSVTFSTGHFSGYAIAD